MNANAQLEDMHGRLTKFYEQNEKEWLCDSLVRHVADPLKPRNDFGGFRISPILLILATLALLVLSVFVIFSFVRL